MDGRNVRLNVDISLDSVASHLEPTYDDPTESSALRQAAVLVVLCPSSGGMWIPLIQRPEDLRHHPGQLALPGGSRDPQDKALVDTAVRETQEEIGISPTFLTLLGRLSPVAVSVSGFQVFPFVAVCTVKPDMTPSATEVTRIVEMPVAALLRPGTIFEQPAREGSSYDTTYAIRLPEGTVWGATARILLEFRTALRAAREGR